MDNFKITMTCMFGFLVGLLFIAVVIIIHDNNNSNIESTYENQLLQKRNIVCESFLDDILKYKNDVSSSSKLEVLIKTYNRLCK